MKGRASKRQWVLDADLSAAFDRINHDRLLEHLGTFPGRGMVTGWLAAGVIERGRFAPTEEGTPQGGVISPMLLNIALHGMEEAAGVRYTRRDPQGAHVASGSPALVRYADDFVVMCHTKAQAEQVHRRLAEWLNPGRFTSAFQVVSFSVVEATYFGNELTLSATSPVMVGQVWAKPS